MSQAARGMISRDELVARVRAGTIDTVICGAFDMQGRLVGKRVTGDHFVGYCLEHGIHLCTYLFGTDMEMNTPGGYQFMNWESGYGDYLALPDWTTARVIPWLEATALVLCDVIDESRQTAVEFTPRQVLHAQVERAAAHGLLPMMASELEFYLLRETYAELAAKQFVEMTPWGWYNEDYQLLQATKGEPIHRQLRNLLSAAGVPVEFSKGEAGAGQHEVNIHYTAAVEAADRAQLYKHGAKEIAHLNNCAITFMAKPDQAWTGSSSHIHISLWDTTGAGNQFTRAADDGREPTGVMRWFLGGLLAASRELSLFSASTINSYKRFAVASWAPVNLVWGRDNRTCSFRLVGDGASLRIENRLPGADANAYLAYAATLAAGLHGIEHELDPGPEFRGNAYQATGVARAPSSLREAMELWEQSEIARAAFGDIVHAHYLNAARVEQETYDAAVTDWERRRYLERG